MDCIWNSKSDYVHQSPIHSMSQFRKSRNNSDNHMIHGDSVVLVQSKLVNIDNVEAYEMKQSESITFDKDLILEEMNVPLSVFLDSEHSTAKHGIFKEYLNFCWAKDTLLFVERVSIVYQILLSNYKSETVAVNSLYRFKFKYLSSIYAEYEVTFAGITNGNFKKRIDDVYSRICHEFIQNGSMKEISLSYDTKHALLLHMNDKFETLLTFEDYLNLFDDALVEMYRVMISVYQYQFAQYIKHSC